MNEFRFNALSYALAKQVPAMERGFTIATSYGDIEIDAEDAAKVADVVRVIVARQLSALMSAAEVGEAWTLEQQDDVGCIRDARGMEIVTTYFGEAVRIFEAHNAAIDAKLSRGEA